MAPGRRVRRVLRKIDAWSVLKVSALFHVTLTAVLLLAGVLLWAVGSSVGAVSSIERFMRSIGFEGFTFVGSQLLRGFVAFGLVLVVLGTGVSVLVAVVYNLITDVVGGVHYVVFEEEADVGPAAEAAGVERSSGASLPAGDGQGSGAGDPPAPVPVHERYLPSGSMSPTSTAPPGA